MVSGASNHAGERTDNHVSMLFPAFCTALMLLVTLPVSAEETGIRGVALWGPVEPGPASPGTSDEAPLCATFFVFAAVRRMAKFKSDNQGKFEVRLPAGDYSIVPDKSTPMPAPQDQGKAVTVPVDGFAEVTLRFDTGMR
jgi:hypothetical protein